MLPIAVRTAHVAPIGWLMLCLLANAPAPAAETWPQLRGPDGQGHASSHKVPTTWSESEHVRWKVPVPGRGWSSPVVLGEQIWITTADEETRALRALSFDRSSGTIVHDVEVYRPETLPTRNAKNSYASPTCALEPGRVYVSFGTLGTACIDGKSGKVLWRNEELRIDHKEGAGSSPIIWNDLVFLNCDGIDAQYQVALDKRTGKIVWKTARSGPLKDNTDFRKAYSTPLVISVAGKPQLVSTGADNLYSYDPATGRELWRIAYDGFSNVPRPLFGHGRLYICTGYMKPQLWAIRPDGDGDVSETHVLWRNTDQVPAVPSPILIDDAIYMVSNNGIATCVDAETGQSRWRERLGGDFWASPVYADGRLYFSNEQGETFVIRPGTRFELLATNPLDAGCMASLAVVDGAIFARTETHLYRIEE